MEAVRFPHRRHACQRADERAFGEPGGGAVTLTIGELRFPCPQGRLRLGDATGGSTHESGEVGRWNQSRCQRRQCGG